MNNKTAQLGFVGTFSAIIGFVVGAVSVESIDNSYHNEVANNTAQAQIIQTLTEKNKTLEQKAEECKPKECQFMLSKTLYDFIANGKNGRIEEEGYTAFYHLERDLKDLEIGAFRAGKLTVSLSECLASACANTVKAELIISDEYFDGKKSVYILDSKSLAGKDLSLKTIRRDNVTVYDSAKLGEMMVMDANGYCDVVDFRIRALEELAIDGEGVKNE